MSTEDVDPRVIKIVDLKHLVGEVGRNLYEISIIFSQKMRLSSLFVIVKIMIGVVCRSISFDCVTLVQKSYSHPVKVSVTCTFGAMDLEDKLKVRMQLQAHKVIWGDEKGR